MSIYIEPTVFFKPKPQPTRLFMALDGRWHITDHLGTRPASALAVALALLPSKRITGFRNSEVTHG
jgi:hypothetical protein